MRSRSFSLETRTNYNKLNVIPKVQIDTMFQISLIIPSIASLLLFETASTGTVGYFDSGSCVDPSGLAECYETAAIEWSKCVNNTCAGQNIDCDNVCSCVQTQNQLNCAGQHCWNQVNISTYLAPEIVGPY